MKLRYLLNEIKPDFIYHLAATVGVKRVLENPKECIENNIESTRSILALGIPGIFASTSEVYGQTDELLHEESPLIYSSKSRWSYAASKLIDEFLVQQAKEWKSVRFFNVVGPRQSGEYGAVLPTFVKQALTTKQLTVYGSGEQVRTFIDVRDCVEILDRLRDEKFDVVNIGGGNILSINELAVKVVKVIDDNFGGILLPTVIRHISYKDAYNDGFEECAVRVPSLNKLESILSVLPITSFDKTILDLARHIKKENQDEQVRQHGEYVQRSETTISRLTGTAVR